MLCRLVIDHHPAYACRIYAYLQAFILRLATSMIAKRSKVYCELDQLGTGSLKQFFYAKFGISFSSKILIKIKCKNNNAVNTRLLCPT